LLVVEPLSLDGGICWHRYSCQSLLMAVYAQAPGSKNTFRNICNYQMAWMKTGNVGPIRATGKPTSKGDDESKLFKLLMKKSGEFLARHVLDRGSIM
jgi:hypothetical protein